jgi:hypothetical protein
LLFSRLANKLVHSRLALRARWPRRSRSSSRSLLPHAATGIRQLQLCPYEILVLCARKILWSRLSPHIIFSRAYSCVPVRTRALTKYWRFAQDALDGRGTALPLASRGARNHGSLCSHPLSSPLIRATPSYPLVPCPYARCAHRILARFAQDTLDDLARDHCSLRSQNTGALRKNDPLVQAIPSHHLFVPVRTLALAALTKYWRFAQDALDGRATALPLASYGARNHGSLRSHPLSSPLIRATPSYPLVPCPYARCAHRILARFAQDTLDGLARNPSSLRSQNTGALRAKHRRFALALRARYW